MYKKRLNGNRHPAILIAKADRFWVFAYLYAKQDRANIDDDELRAFRALGALYRQKTERDLQVELVSGALTEICDET